MKRILEMIIRRKKITVEELAKELKLNEDFLRGVIQTLKKKNAVDVEKEIVRIVKPGKRLIKIRTLPEIAVLKYLLKNESGDLKKIFKNLKIPEDDLKIGIGKLISKKIIKIKKVDEKQVVEKLIDEIPNELNEIDILLKKILRKKELEYSKLSTEEAEALKRILNRPGFIEIREKIVEYVFPTDKAQETLKKISEGPIITKLTREMIVNKTWDKYVFKEYDLNERFFSIYPGKLHPMRRLIREIKEVFLSMGFEEATGPLIEVAFRNFDMLFQPQDHPARDMQDTFYLKKPEYGDIEYPNEIIERVKTTHENGWRTGSSGWREKWKLEEARKLVLRTHTTSVSVAKMYEIGEKPTKIFSIGRVFRNETIDYKHLAEFMQIDGIIINKNANLRELMGVIREFYSKLGFKNIRFWPSYFPYTEPSIQPSIYVEKWGKWLELGGAGIFRPEVTVPLGVRWPVLAWGLGIERLLMIKYDIDDIRMIYLNDLEWLRGVGLRL